MTNRKHLLWIGDAACPSGFARATHGILDVVSKHYDVTVLGINYHGDPYDYPYPIYGCEMGGDAMGYGRMIWMCDLIKRDSGSPPDVIVVQNDGWNVPYYVKKLSYFDEYKSIPVVAAVAVDGRNFHGRWLDGVALAIFWTQFALDEARLGGYEGDAVVIPLGVDLDIYKPLDHMESRRRRGIPSSIDSAFIIGNVNRNQPRKRWDLTIRYFAEWVTRESIDDAYLFLHVAPTGDMGVNVIQLARYYGVIEYLLLNVPPVNYGESELRLCDTYNCFDVQISTTQGEGFGLTTFEGMACAVPQVVPDWSALGEICRDAALLVPCTSTAITYGDPSPNVIGGVVDQEQFINALDQLYRVPSLRAMIGNAGLNRVSEERYRWSNIGQRYVEVLDAIMIGKRADLVGATIDE